MPRDVVSTEVAAGTTDVDVTTTKGFYHGCALHNQGAAAATVLILDGNGGRLLDVFVIDAGKTGGSGPSAVGIRAQNGIRIDRDGSNSVRAAIWHS